MSRNWFYIVPLALVLVACGPGEEPDEASAERPVAEPLQTCGEFYDAARPANAGDLHILRERPDGIVVAACRYDEPDENGTAPYTEFNFVSGTLCTGTAGQKYPYSCRGYDALDSAQQQALADANALLNQDRYTLRAF